MSWGGGGCPTSLPTPHYSYCVSTKTLTTNSFVTTSTFHLSSPPPLQLILIRLDLLSPSAPKLTFCFVFMLLARPDFAPNLGIEHWRSGRIWGVISLLFLAVSLLPWDYFQRWEWFEAEMPLHRVTAQHQSHILQRFDFLSMNDSNNLASNWTQTLHMIHAVHLYIWWCYAQDKYSALSLWRR